jgi:hypothetical protein
MEKIDEEENYYQQQHYSTFNRIGPLIAAVVLLRHSFNPNATTRWTTHTSLSLSSWIGYIIETAHINDESIENGKQYEKKK